MLLDDPLSAVDAAVSRHLFDRWLHIIDVVFYAVIPVCTFKNFLN